MKHRLINMHADRCMQTLTECTAAVRDRTATADHLELQLEIDVCTCDLLDPRPVARRMIGRASFIGLIPRRWITIAATLWQFLATGGLLLQAEGLVALRLHPVYESAGMN